MILRLRRSLVRLPAKKSRSMGEGVVGGKVSIVFTGDIHSSSQRRKLADPSADRRSTWNQEERGWERRGTWGGEKKF